jgi:hypothetical protein
MQLIILPLLEFICVLHRSLKLKKDIAIQKADMKYKYLKLHKISNIKRLKTQG